MSYNNWVDYYNDRAKNISDRLIASEMYLGDSEESEIFLEYEKNRILSILKPTEQEPAKKLIDLGCSTGVMLEKLSSYYNDITGVDLAHNTLLVAKERLPEINFINDDITKLDKLKDKKFDFVLSYGVLQFLDDNQLIGLFKAIDMITSKGSKILLIRIPNKQHYKLYQEYRKNRKGLAHNQQPDNSSILSWNWISEDFIFEYTNKYADVNIILPTYGTQYPLLGFMDVLLIKK